MTMPQPETNLMRGATRIHQIVAEYLGNTIPHLIDVAREQWGLADYQLPYPLRYDVYDPMSTSVYPVVGSYLRNTRGFGHTDYPDPMQDEYWPTYSMTVFAWVRTPAQTTNNWEDPVYDSTIRLRDDMTTIVRAAMLSRQSFGYPDEFRIVEETLVEDYLDAIKSSDQTPHWMAGCTLTIDVQHRELTYREPVGVSENIDLKVQRLPITDTITYEGAS